MLREISSWVLLICLSLICLGRNSGAAQLTLRYEPAITTLTGTLYSRTFPGPPNYESIKKGDVAESAWLLKLSQPVTVLEDGVDPAPLNETETNVEKVHLVVIEEKDFKTIRALVGKTTSCRGTLFHAFTGHHRAKILMTISKCWATNQD